MAAMLRTILLAIFAALTVAQRPAMFQKEIDGTPLSVTPTILTGFLIFLFWVTLFTTGICCLFNVQTPQTFEEKGLSMHKTY